MNHPRRRNRNQRPQAPSPHLLTELRQRFQDALNAALISGSSPSRSLGLKPRTLAALTRVSAAHPDATADHIAAAYDAFEHEHA